MFIEQTVQRRFGFHVWRRVESIDLEIYMGSLTRSFEGLNYIQHRANSLSVSQLAITHIMNISYILLISYLIPSKVSIHNIISKTPWKMVYDYRCQTIDRADFI